MSEPFIEDWRALLTEAHEALRTAVLGVAADAWGLPTPCAKWTVAQVLQHAAGDQIGFAAAITGGPWPSEDPFAPSGQLARDPLAIVDEAVRRSAEAWKSSLSRRSSRSRPTNGASNPSPLSAPRAPDTTRSARQSGTSPVLPGSSWLPACS